MSNPLTCVSQVKERNVYEIKTALRAMESGTKQSVAQATGLSITTCNSILNELYKSGEVLLVDEPSRRNVGRPAKSYQFNKDFKYACCLNLVRNFRSEDVYFHSTVLNMVGEIIEDEDKCCPYASYEKVEKILQKLIEKYPQIDIVCFGIAGFYDSHRLQSSWFSPESDQDIVRDLSASLNRKIIVENDMNAIAYGAYKDMFSSPEHNVSSLAVISFFDNDAPGAGIIYDGQILHGYKNFAGEVAYLPVFGETEKYPREPEQVFRAAVQVVESVTSVLNPEVCLLTGESLNQTMVDQIPDACSSRIPKNVLPKLLYSDHYYDLFIDGLYYIALDYIMKADL